MEGSTLECKYLRKMYVIDECLEMRFMTLKVIGIEIIFGTANFSLENWMIIQDVISEISRFRYLKKYDISKDYESLKIKIQFLN